MGIADSERSLFNAGSRVENIKRTRQIPQQGVAKVQLPSFLIAGPPRTGSSWIHEVLRYHANLPTPTKETRFFDCHFQRGLRWYGAHFKPKLLDRPVGEVAPTYFASAAARESIARTLPDVKLVFIFRNPLERVLSLYRVKVAYGWIPWSFEEALEKDPELLNSAMYLGHLAEWRRLFADGQIQNLIYDDLRNAPQRFVESLTEFLDLPRIVLTPSQLGSMHSSERMTQPRSYLATSFATTFANWCKSQNLDAMVAMVRQSAAIKLFLGGGAPFPEVSRSTARRLAALFQPEIDGLEALLSRDLSAWKSAH